MSTDRKSIENHIKTHSYTAALDRAAVSVLNDFLLSARIFTKFVDHDNWPNHDGIFEYVPDPDESRRPKQNFLFK